MDLLTVEHVTKQYAGHKALDDVSLAIPKGSVYGLLGPNGAVMRLMMRIRVVFPAPLGPSRPYTQPVGMASDK